MTEEQRIISIFLSSSPLYKKIRIGDSNFKPAAYKGVTFDFECKPCKATKTFSLESVSDFLFNKGVNTTSYVTTIYQKDIYGKENYTEHYKGLCKACGKYSIDLVLNTSRGLNLDEDKESIKEVLFLKKVGQNPPHVVRPVK